jgi:hypothetical protein
MTRETILATVTTDEHDRATTQDGPHLITNRAVALEAILSEAERELTSGERNLLSEWPDGLIDPARSPTNLTPTMAGAGPAISQVPLCRFSEATVPDV